jgi:hypothetical protein
MISPFAAAGLSLTPARRATECPNRQFGFAVLQGINDADASERPGRRSPLEFRTAERDRLHRLKAHEPNGRAVAHCPDLRQRDQEGEAAPLAPKRCASSATSVGSVGSASPAVVAMRTTWNFETFDRSISVRGVRLAEHAVRDDSDERAPTRYAQPVRRNFDPEFRILRRPPRWRPDGWLRRIRPSAAKRVHRTAPRCSRCGIWGDQATGVSGDWLIVPVCLCPGCHQRVMSMLARLPFGADLDAEIRTVAARWPIRG